MNPSRSFGPALVGGVWDDLWIYFVACPLGAAAAAFVYHRVILAGRE
jgi:glycerol uptake facilitator-like aquaporin